MILGSHVGKINLFNTETGEKVQSLDTLNRLREFNQREGVGKALTWVRST